jgi:ABC-type Fe3+/spermidine/putrescine transport system ATPase subunit
MNKLRLVELEKSFGPTHAVRRVTFEMAEGEILALLGPSGCGKSTVLAMIAGLEGPDRGEIYWDDLPMQGIPPHQRDFGLMFQDFALFPHMNVFENIAFGLRMAAWQEGHLQQRVGEVLELVGLAGFDRRDVNTLSGGEQQRVALARSLAPKPRLLMLDEPLGSLDRALRERLVVELRHILQSSNQTAIYVTHDQEEAFALADRVVVMNAGRIEQIGTPRMIYRQPATAFVARFVGLSNLFSGQVQQDAEGKAIATPLGRFAFPSEATGQVMVLLHPDAIRLEAKAGPREISLEGQVVERSFRGSLCRLVILANGIRLTFDFPSNSSLPSVGERTHLVFEPQQAIQLFPLDADLQDSSHGAMIIP